MTKRVVVLPSDETACGWYRMRLPAGAVQQVRPDWQIDVFRPRDVILGADIMGRLQQVQGLPSPKDVDLLIMQRVATPAQVDLCRWYQTNGVGVIVDADDAMWCIDPENAAHPAWNDNPLRHWRWIDQAASTADITTVTTPLLAKHYGNRGHSEILPNCVPAEVSELDSLRAQLDQTITIGWAGFTATHPRDLRVVGDAVRRVQQETGCIVRVIGDAEGAMRDWGLDTIEGVDPTPIGAPYFTALTSLDVGLVPLEINPFNRAKSYLKALEFSAMGIPVVASATPANWELRKTVPIYLATTEDEWYEFISELVTRPSTRQLAGQQARAAVQEHHTYEGNAEKWAQVWERAMARRDRMSA